MTSAKLTETDIIARYFAPLAKAQGAFGLRDDAAALSPEAGCDLVVTADMLVAGVHFFRCDSPGDIAKKALRVNLSDLAAKGAEPLGYLLSVALPNDWQDADRQTFLQEFSHGLGEDQDLFGLSLLGGDTVATPGPLCISITALGQVPAGGHIPRFGARPADAIFVTGTIGDAALGLGLRKSGSMNKSALTAAHENMLLERYLLPQPRLGLGSILRRYDCAAMDVSDGLAGDVAKMCNVSGTSASIACAHVPLSPAARVLVDGDDDGWRTVLTGGDDYELLIAVRRDHADQFSADMRQRDVPVTKIGVMTKGEGTVTVIAPDGKELLLDAASFTHF